MRMIINTTIAIALFGAGAFAFTGVLAWGMADNIPTKIFSGALIANAVVHFTCAVLLYRGEI